MRAPTTFGVAHRCHGASGSQRIPLSTAHQADPMVALCHRLRGASVPLDK